MCKPKQLNGFSQESDFLKSLSPWPQQAGQRRTMWAMLLYSDGVTGLEAQRNWQGGEAMPDLQIMTISEGDISLTTDSTWQVLYTGRQNEKTNAPALEGRGVEVFFLFTHLFDVGKHRRHISGVFLLTSVKALRSSGPHLQLLGH
jgi:hypothetical protein